MERPVKTGYCDFHFAFSKTEYLLLSVDTLTDKIRERNLPVAVWAIPHIGNGISRKFITGKSVSAYRTFHSGFELVFPGGCDSSYLPGMTVNSFAVNCDKQCNTP